MDNLPNAPSPFAFTGRTGVITVVVLLIVGAVGFVLILPHVTACPNPNGLSGVLPVPTAPARWVESASTTTPANSATDLAVNLTFTATQDANGFGPSFFLSGATNEGYGYEVGVAWQGALNGTTVGAYASGYTLEALVYPPASHGVPLIDYVRGIALNPRFPVDLELSLFAQCVAMEFNQPYDLSPTYLLYNSYGATSFVNATSVGPHLANFVTGLSTQWWHAAPYYGPMAVGNYSLPIGAGSDVTLNISESSQIFGGTVLFGQARSADLSCGCTTVLTYQNVTASVNSTEFTTA
jgi:hypothetical protein